MAEMTGRRGRMVRSGRRDKVHYELRDSGGNSLESLNNREVGSQATPHGFLLKFLFAYYPFTYTDDCLCAYSAES